jgi:hypothetical protein
MNGKHWSKVGGGMGAVLFAALMAARLGGCKLLKPKAKGALGVDCVTDLDCESLMCSTTGNVCSKACTYDKDCGGDLVCRRKDDNSGNWCSKAIGNAPNTSCMNTWDCQHNECLKYVGKEDQPGLCTKYCATPDDCPAGEKICEKISDTGMLKVCLPGDPAAAPSARPQFKPTPYTPRGTPAPRPQPRPAAAPQPAPQPQPAHTTAPTHSTRPGTRRPGR